MVHRLFDFQPAHRRTAGFTLAELLIVMAIVAVLVAIAIPLFTSAIGNTEAATCESNRRSLKSIYTSAYLLDPSQDQKQLFETCAEQLKEQNKGVLCPNDGRYRATFNKLTGAVYVTCLIHGASDEDRVYDWLENTSWTGGDDSAHRNEYAESKALEEWPEVFGTDGTSVYLSFKTFGNSSDTAYLYAGPAKSTSDTNPWRASYLCDTTGKIFGTPGQWYRLPKELNLGTKPDSTGEALRSSLAKACGEDYASTLEKVNLVNGKFAAA